MEFLIINIAIVVLLLIFTFYLRYRTIMVIKPLFRLLVEKHNLPNESDIQSGVVNVIFSLGFVLMLILWLFYLKHFSFSSHLAEYIIYIMLALVIIFSYVGYAKFKKAFNAPVKKQKKKKIK